MDELKHNNKKPLSKGGKLVLGRSFSGLFFNYQLHNVCYCGGDSYA